MNGDYDPSHARVWTVGLKPAPFEDVYYDAADDELVAGNSYMDSPSGKWGLKYIMYFNQFIVSRGNARGYVYEKRVTVLLKNKQIGIINQIGDYSYWPTIYWLPDGTILQQRYSEESRQNEIVRIHPDTAETKRLFLGALRAYNANLGLALYVHIEPSRRLRIYDFRTGKSRLAVEGEAEALFYRREEKPVVRPVPPEVPAELDVESLPVAKTTYRQAREATLILDGKEIPLPYAFFGTDRKLYVPLRPVSDSLDWKTVRLEGDEYRYSVKTDKGELILDKTNTKLFNDRLFIRVEDIRVLGYTNSGIEWETDQAAGL